MHEQEEFGGWEPKWSCIKSSREPLVTSKQQAQVHDGKCNIYSDLGGEGWGWGLGPCQEAGCSVASGRVSTTSQVVFVSGFICSGEGGLLPRQESWIERSTILS